MTWERKNGDSNHCGRCPNICSYKGMDSLTRARHLILGNKIESVGAGWRYIRNKYPEIELYSSDCSHPSINGSFVGALSFFTVIARNNPSKIAYNTSISPTITLIIKDAIEKIAYDSLYYWNVGITAFSYKKGANNLVSFHNLSCNYDSLLCDFGDEQNYTEKKYIVPTSEKRNIQNKSLHNKTNCFSSDISMILRRLK